MNRNGFAPIFVIAVIVVILAIGLGFWCISSKSSAHSTFENNFQYGEIVTSTIGSAGGVIKNSDDSIMVIIPPAALSQSTTLTLSFRRSDYAVKAGVGSPVTFTIYPDIGLNSAVNIKIKYDPLYQLPIPYLINSQNKLEVADLRNIDKEDNSFTMVTFHGGSYSWIYGD